MRDLSQLPSDVASFLRELAEVDDGDCAVCMAMSWYGEGHSASCPFAQGRLLAVQYGIPFQPFSRSGQHLGLRELDDDEQADPDEALIAAYQSTQEEPNANSTPIP